MYPLITEMSFCESKIRIDYRDKTFDDGDIIL